MKKKIVIITILAFFVMLPGALSGCIHSNSETYPIEDDTLPSPNESNDESLLEENGIVIIKPVEVPLAMPPSLIFIPMPVASGIMVKKNDRAEIDYSNTQDGYVMVRYLGKKDKKTMTIVKGPGGESYTYYQNSNGSFECFPLSEGNGSYQVGIYENIKGDKYSAVISTTFQVELIDEFAPFLRPNQYVNFTSSSETVKKAMEIVNDSSEIVGKISAVYNYVSKNIVYDKDLAKTVKSGYLSDVDAVLKNGKGICFDYAAVMTVMLRSQQIPTKLVIGYAGNAYHAWINVYSTETGWIDNVVYFDGKNWVLMDPTFASNKTDGNTKNVSYNAKLVY